MDVQIQRKITSALMKLRRSLENGGIDPVSGYTAEDIESYLQKPKPKRRVVL